jgi:hypothetical protein
MNRCTICKLSLKYKRTDAKTCVNRCRQMAFRRRAGVTARRYVRRTKIAPKAHQRRIREQLAIQHPTPLATDIKTSTVREISYHDAEAIISKFEYLGTMPPSTRHCFGIFFADRLAGAVVYADEPAENLGVWGSPRLRQQDHNTGTRRLRPLGASA